MNQSRLYSLYESDPAPVVDFIEYLRALYGLPTPGRILDMGCGPGRLLEPLGREGWDVTGYEPDPDYVAAARQAICRVATGRVGKGGFLDLDEEDAFDLIAAVNGPYCHVLEASQRREALTRCARALKPGGVLFLDLSNFWWVLRNYRYPEVIAGDIDGIQVTRTARHELDYHRGLLTHHDRYEWTDAEGHECSASKTHRIAMVPFSEIALFLDDLGFTDVYTFNSYADRKSAELTGKKLMVTARLG